MLIHSVYFWLKPGVTAAETSGFRTEVEKLGKIRSIEKIYVGPPAPVAHRDVTDHSFAIGLTILFKDGPAHDSYQTDPLHLEFIERNKALWEKVLVFDSQE